MCCVNLCPRLNHWHNLGGRKVGEGEVVSWGEGEDEAFSCYWLRAEEEG